MLDSHHSTGKSIEYIIWFTAHQKHDLSSKTEVMFSRTTIKWKTDRLNIISCLKLFSKSKNSLKKISRKTIFDLLIE